MDAFIDSVIDNMKHGGDVYSDTIEYDFSVNLNPINCSDIINTIMNLDISVISTYPDPLQRDFRKAVAAVEGVDDKEVIGGNGASELLMALGMLLRPLRVMLSNPCFSGYHHVFEAIEGCKIIEHRLAEDNGFQLDMAFVDTLKKEVARGLDLVVLTNPNNPTGKNISKEILMRVYEVCKQYGVKLIVDECFIRMSSNAYSMAMYINDYDGLFVVNAFTKLFSIPGIRVGYVISDSKNIDRLSRFLPEWNMSVIAQKAGVICCEYLKNNNWEDRTRSVIEEEKKYLCNGLRQLGLKVYESDTGFVLFYTKENLYDYLKDKKILIRDLSEISGLGVGYYRVAVKNHRENELLLETLAARK